MLEVLKVFFWSTVMGVPPVMYWCLAALLCMGVIVLVLWHGVNQGLKYSAVLLLVEWLFLVFYVTVLCRDSGGVRDGPLFPFWSYINPKYPVEVMALNVLNVILFVPVGFLLGFGFKNITWKKVLLTGCCLSVVVELLQLVFQKGFCEVDDVMHNTLGCLIGYGGYMMIKTLICHPWVCERISS